MPTSHHTESVAVLGLGLVGGSLLRALGSRARGFDVDPSVRAAAAAAGYAVADSVAAAVDGVPLVVLAGPLPALPGLLAAVAATDAATEAVVTDVGSVKGSVVAAARDAGVRRYVGGHPMAGSEHSGWGAGDPGLFTGARWVLCLEPDTDLDAWLAVAATVTELGALAVPLTARVHDRAVARVSHLPYLLAAALAVEAGDPVARALAAGSFRDGTRVAGGDPGLPAAMLAGNRAEALSALDDAQQRLADVRSLLAAGADPRPVFDAARSARRSWAERDRGEVVAIPAETGALLALGAAGGAVTAVDVSPAGTVVTARHP